MPFLFDGVVINFIEILQDLYPKITQVKIVSKNSVVVFASVIFDQKAVSSGGCLYSGGLYGILPPISGQRCKYSITKWISQYATKFNQ